MFDGTNEAQPQPIQPDPLETALAQEWQSAQLGQQHVAEVIGKIVAAWRSDRARIADLEAQLAAIAAERSAATMAEPR